MNKNKLRNLKILIFLYLGIATLTFASIAFAEPATTSNPVIPALPLKAMITLVVCQVVAYFMRALAPTYHWFHTKLGAFVIALFTAALSGAIGVIGSQGLNVSAIEWAVLNGALSVLTVSNPSNFADAATLKDTVKVMLPVLFVFGISGCATTTNGVKQTPTQTIQHDAKLVAQIINDVKTVCGPDWAPIGPSISLILQTAENPSNALGDILAVVQAFPALAEDVKALTCTIRVVVDDLRNAKKPSAAIVGEQVEDMLPDAYLADVRQIYCGSAR